jgi:hypothetical protein
LESGAAKRRRRGRGREIEIEREREREKEIVDFYARHSSPNSLKVHLGYAGEKSLDAGSRGEVKFRGTMTPRTLLHTRYKL